MESILTIDTSAAGDHCRMWLGDLNGDGRMEMVLCQADSGIDDRYVPHQVQAATAFDLDGKVLWQVGTVDPQAKPSGADIPAQLYDFDGDGVLELLCVMNGKLCAFDGKTGALKKQAPLPADDAHDCIILADLFGRGRCSILLKNRYSTIWALDEDWNAIWSFTGNTGHFPWPYDLDGDGKEEIIVGYHVLRGDGTLWWEMDMDDHADCIWVCDLFGDGVPHVLIGGSDTRAYRWDGKLIWKYDGTVESQNIAPAKLDDGPYQICGLDRIDRTENGIDGVFLLDCHGKPLFTEHRKERGWSSIVTAVDGLEPSGLDYIAAFRRGGGMRGGLFNAKMEAQFLFPFEGYIMWGDLCGSGLNQLVLYENGHAEIFSSRPLAQHGDKPLPQPKRLYNNTRYWGGER